MRLLTYPLGAIVVASLLAACRTSGVTNVDTSTPVDCILNGPTVTPSAATLHPGDTLRVRMTEAPCGAPQSVFAAQWASSDTTVAAVDATGLVRARAGGTATIIGRAVQDPNLVGAMALVVAP